jgi:hypothetical protein
MTYLAVTPIPQELEILSRYLAKNGFKPYNGMMCRLSTIEFPDLDLILAQGGLGKFNSDSKRSTCWIIVPQFTQLYAQVRQGHWQCS